MKKITFLFLITSLCLLFSIESFAAQPHIAILEYPKVIYAGEAAEIKVEWRDIPVGKDYFLRVQLENWDVGLCMVRDIENLPPTNTQTISLNVPSNITLNAMTTRCRFVAAFLSKERDWQDVACSHSTLKHVEILSHISIINYPTIVTPGKPARVRVMWDKAPSDKEYKLNVQLENFDARPQVCIVKTITQFKSADIVIVTLDIPLDLKSNPFVAGYRFVAAFISKSRDWNDIYAVGVTPRNVEVQK